VQPNELAPPTIKDTALYRVPLWAFNLVAGRFLSKKDVDGEYSGDEFDENAEAGSGEDADDFEVLEKVKTSAQNGTGNGKAVRRNKKNGRGR
jgi:hypothetical protein